VRAAEVVVVAHPAGVEERHRAEAEGPQRDAGVETILEVDAQPVRAREEAPRVTAQAVVLAERQFDGQVLRLLDGVVCDAGADRVEAVGQREDPGAERSVPADRLATVPTHPAARGGGRVEVLERFAGPAHVRRDLGLEVAAGAGLVAPAQTGRRAVEEAERQVLHVVDRVEAFDLAVAVDAFAADAHAGEHALRVAGHADLRRERPRRRPVVVRGQRQHETVGAAAVLGARAPREVAFEHRDAVVHLRDGIAVAVVLDLAVVVAEVGAVAARIGEVLERAAHVEADRVTFLGAADAHRPRVPRVEQVQVGVGDAAAELVHGVLGEAQREAVAEAEHVVLAGGRAIAGHAADVRSAGAEEQRELVARDDLEVDGVLGAGRDEAHGDVGEQAQRAQVALELGGLGGGDHVAGLHPELAADRLFARHVVQRVDEAGERVAFCGGVGEHVAARDQHLAQPAARRSARLLGHERRGEHREQERGMDSHRVLARRVRLVAWLGKMHRAPWRCQTRST
jgi:hypothetical protein